MAKQKVTLSIDSQKYKDYQKICKENAIMMSQRIEVLIEKDAKFLKKLFGGKKT